MPSTFPQVNSKKFCTKQLWYPIKALFALINFKERERQIDI